MKTSVRAAGIKSINNNRGGLGASELHGKRLDTTSQKRIITAPNSINWSKAGDDKGLDLVEAFKAHKKEMGAVERGNAEIGTHLLVVVPPEWIREGGDIHDPKNSNTLKAIKAAKEWAESWQGEGAVFAYRFDLDEKGTGVIDLFTAPVFEQGRRNGKTVKTISPSMAKRELVKQTEEKTSGAAFQSSWAEWAQMALDSRMQRGNRKKETGREHVHAEVYAKVAESVKAEITQKIEQQLFDENDLNDRIRKNKFKQKMKEYEKRQRELEQEFDDKQYELEQAFDKKEAELKEYQKEIEKLYPDFEKRQANLEKREAAVEANEAKKLTLFNKSKVIQNKLAEIEKDEIKYSDRVDVLEADYLSRRKVLEADHQKKAAQLQWERNAFEKERDSVKELLDYGGSVQKAQQENENLKSQFNSAKQILEQNLSYLKGELQTVKTQVAAKTKTIEAQNREIKTLTSTKKLFDFVDAFLKKNFGEVYKKLAAAWNNSPENPKNENNDRDYGGPSM